MANCGCPEGYTLNAKTGLCESTTTVEAVWTGATIPVIRGCINPNYSARGLRLYEDISGYTAPITGQWVSNAEADYYLEDSLGGVIEILEGFANPATPGNTSGVAQSPFLSSLWGLDYDITPPINCIDPGITSATYNGRLNNAGIWSDPGNTGNPPCGGQFGNTTVNFDFCVDVETSKQYLIGLGGDNTCRIYLDGTLLVEVNGTDAQKAPFRLWHVIPITLSAGTHVITLEGYNASGAATFAGEIYDITLAEFQAALLSPADSGDPSFPDSATCGNTFEDLLPYIIFTTESYINNAIPDLTDTEGQWLCDGEPIPGEVCGTTPLCTTTDTLDPLDCCYTIESCNDQTQIEIQLDTTETLDLVVGNVYTFADPGENLVDCYKVLSVDACDIPLYTNVVVAVDHDNTDCNVCIPCYELTDCEDPENTVIIQWDPEAAPLEEGTSYVFDFDPTKCWSAELQFSPCQGTLYTTENIVTTYVDCDECLKPCYKLIDCENDLSCCINIKIYNGPGYGEALLTTPSGTFENSQPYWQFELNNPAPPLGDGLPTGIFVELSQINGIGDWKLYTIPAIPSIPNSGIEILTAIENPTVANCPSDLPIPSWVVVDEAFDGAETNSCAGGNYPTISTENTAFEVYVGKVIQWQDQLGETHCATVEKYTCKDETWPAEPIVVLDCFDTCEECLPQPVPEPIFELDSRSVRPGYNTPACDPAYYEKVRCKYSEALYQEMISKRYGIETCCDIDERKYEIKHELLMLDALKTPYLCDPICATYNFSVYLNDGDTAEVQYVDCEGVEQTVTADAFVGQYEIEICALTTFRPVIVITRADSSVEQYYLETQYQVCCEESEFYEYEFTVPDRPFGDPGVTFWYTDSLGVERQVIVPECSSKECAGITRIFCAAYGSVRVSDVAAPGTIYASNETCPNGDPCVQDSRLTRVGDCP